MKKLQVFFYRREWVRWRQDRVCQSRMREKRQQSASRQTEKETGLNERKISLSSWSKCEIRKNGRRFLPTMKLRKSHMHQEREPCDSGLKTKQEKTRGSRRSKNLPPPKLSPVEKQVLGGWALDCRTKNKPVSQCDIQNQVMKMFGEKDGSRRWCMSLDLHHNSANLHLLKQQISICINQWQSFCGLFEVKSKIS